MKDLSDSKLETSSLNGEHGEPATLHSIQELIEGHIQLSHERHRWLSNHILEAKAMIARATFPARLPLWFIAGALFAIAGLLAYNAARG